MTPPAPGPWHPEVWQCLLDFSSGPRRLLGIVGPPGSGKSTLASTFTQALGARAQAVPMDGFHLAQTELERLGRAGRKGAPDTFDAAGYCALLQRLRNQPPGNIVYAPEFRRAIEEPVACALPVFPDTPLVVTEGNYLLLDGADWGAVAGLIDEIWYLNVAPALRLARLLQRHQQFGRTRAQALDWIAATDEPNARRIEASAPRAHRQLGWSDGAGRFEFLSH